MGRQVTFFMAKEDEDRFLDFVRQTGNVAIVPAISPDNNFQLVERLPEPFSVNVWRQFYIWNRSITPSYRTEYVPDKGYYIINGLLSSLVEFSRSYVKDNTMFPGHLWAEFTIVDDDTNDLGQKDRDFRNWYEALAKWIRREFMHTGWMMFAGRGALKFQDKGGRLPIGL
jgi:hypothetical protein